MRHNRDIFSIFFNIKVFCVFSLEPPDRGDSNEYTKYTIFNIKRQIDQNYLKSIALGIFPRDSSTSSKLRWLKWLTFHFHTTSQFRIPNSEFRNMHCEFRNSEFGIVKYMHYGQVVTANLL